MEREMDWQFGVASVLLPCLTVKLLGFPFDLRSNPHL